MAIAVALSLGHSGETELIKGIFAMSPFISGEYPNSKCPSTKEFNGYILYLAKSYKRFYSDVPDHSYSPFAWPINATTEQISKLPPCRFLLNECDPLRDEGLSFYRSCRAAGVDAECVVVAGSVHGSELMYVSRAWTQNAVDSAVSFACRAGTSSESTSLDRSKPSSHL